MTIWPSICYRFQTLLDITRQARMQLVWKTTSLFRASRGTKKQTFCREKSYTYGAHCLSKFVLVHQPNDDSSIPVLTGRKEQHGHYIIYH